MVAADRQTSEGFVAVTEPIDDPADIRIAHRYRTMRFWEKGFSVAKCWYHEEWEGAGIQLDLARDIAQAIEDEINND